MATSSDGIIKPPKQIRFVNNQGQPPSKRRRVNAACLTCRKRKTRCDGERPTCTTCDRNGHHCLGYPEYPNRTKREPTTSPVKLEGGDPNDYSAEIEEDDTEQDGYEHGRRHSKAQNRASQQPQVAREGGNHRKDRGDSSTPGIATTTKMGKDSIECEADPSNTQIPGRSAKGSSLQQTASCSEDGHSSSTHRESHRVPYFRYFGPTAIVPGFKQMVVNVQHYHRRYSRGGSMSAASPGSMLSHHSSLPSLAETIMDAPDDLPVYDPNDPVAVHPITTSLIKTFFLHLGCSYPFLREEKVLRLLKEKQLEAILVDAMCALAARFSNIEALATGGGSSKSDYGNIFAQRARAATVDTFPCPTVGAVQAYLLLAYEGFGANQDSTLWMYLGLAIRMAFDLGLQRSEGVQYQGDKDPWYTRSWNHTGGDEEDVSTVVGDGGPLNPQEQREIVQERIDTAWAVYVLDRIISSGTGRPVTVRDEEFELPLPEAMTDLASGWPLPYPAFIQIIQFYGRVSDVLNKIKREEDLTEEKMSMLAKIEHDLTDLYHKQDPRLHFNPLHFQTFVKNGQGTTFILLHVWFHALIILLHQPLLTYYGKKEPQLTPHSRELAMSSAKTIADILALSDLIDSKSYIGNPFTSQPIYIAACAFLTESAATVSQPVSRNPTPPTANGNNNVKGPRTISGKTSSGAEARSSKHSLLADAANKNYQRCHNSLQQIILYWGGANYILVVLEHRSKGKWDCETYTTEEYESTRLPRRPAALGRFAGLDNPSSPQPSIPPIAWSLTGTTNSPNSSLTLLYQNMNAGSQPVQLHPPAPPPPPVPTSAPTPPGMMIYDPIRQSLPESTNAYLPNFPQPNLSAIRFSAPNPNRLSSSRPAHLAPGSRGGRTPDVGPGTPGSESRLQVLSGLASNTPVLPPLSGPYTPSSNYEPSGLQGASPSSSVADPPASSHQQQNQRTGQLGGPVPGHSSASVVGPYAQDFATDGIASGAYSYSGGSSGGGGAGSDAITVEEFNIGSLGLLDNMMLPWDYFPGDFSGLFDVNNLGEENQEQI